MESKTGEIQDTRSMSLEEYINQELGVLGGQMDKYSERIGGNVSIINSGDITLDEYPARKIVLGEDGSPAGVAVASIKGTRLYTILYAADPSDYDTYLPGVQNMVDTLRMVVS
jgi:hypothetical protein